MVELALRSSVDTSSQLSPLDIWTGRQVRLPADMAYNVEDPISSVTSDEYIKRLRRRLEIMYKIQQDARASSRKDMIDRYSATKARPYEFKEGMLVYVYNSVLQDDLPRKWQGSEAYE